MANIPISLPLFTSKDEASESIRRTIISALDNYKYCPNLQNIALLTKLSAADRALIRFITSKPTRSECVHTTSLPLTNFGRNSPLIPSRNCQNIIKNFLQISPLLLKELEILATNCESVCELGLREERQKCMTGRLMGAIPQVPCAPIMSDQDQFKFKLPVRKEQYRLITLINENQIVVITGHQGSGKSTQIPQIILEDHHARSQRCRIICTQPRRLLAHANADRVAHERKETVGQSVGYQIRLESKASPKTVLTFCTHGVLLRTIFADLSLLNATTHIIVDELDEMDLFTSKLNDSGQEIHLPMSVDSSKHTCNLLLGILQRILPQYSHLKLILVVNLNADSVVSANPCFRSPSANHENSIENGKYLHMKQSVLQIGRPVFPEKSSNFPCYVENFLPTPQYRNAVVYSLMTERKSTEIYFLEDILQWLDFHTPEMETSNQVIHKDAKWARKMYYWLTGTQLPPRDFHDNPTFDNNNGQMEYRDTLNSSNFRNIDSLIWALWENLVLHNVCIRNNQDSIVQNNMRPLISDLLQSISVEWIPVDYRHSETGITPLMLFSAAGQHEVVERLLNMGADVFERIPLPLAALPRNLVTLGTDRASPTYNTSNRISVIGANAYDLARLYGHAHMAELLRSHMAACSIDNSVDDWESNLLRFGCWFANPTLQTPSLLHSARISEFTQNYEIWENIGHNESITHRLYQIARNSPRSDSVIDFDLLTQLILKIDSTLPPGGILVFMPSYETIITLKELLATSTGESSRQWWIFVLHARMLVADLKQIYLQPTSDIRKIIISTDIAEHNIPITEIAYVIDTGLIIKKGEDSKTGNLSNQHRWIKYNSAVQRQYIAQISEKPKCFHLFSRLRMASLENVVENSYHQTSCCAMEEVCLQAKLLCAPGENLGACFLSMPRLPDPRGLEWSIRRLHTLDALDDNDNLTELGSHMCDLPLPPRYSKMVLISIVLKCVDPVLTIACILASENPFIFPNSAKERKEAQVVRKKFSADSLSDHMVLLRAFQFWQKARFEGWEQSFCKKNYVSAAAFDIVTTVRTQLLGQLRASGFVKARGSGDIRDLNTNSENWAVVKAAIVAGMYDNLARVDSESGNLIILDSSAVISRENQNRSACIVRPSPLSVLAMNPNDSFPVNLRQLPSNWLVYDKLIGQGPVRDNGRKASSAKIKRCKNAVIEERRLLNCVTVVSPLTTALLAGPVRTPVICMPTEGSESNRQNYELLRNKICHRNQPLTMADIDQILRNFSTEVPRLETLNVYHPEESSKKAHDSPGMDQKRTVILRLDGSAGILSYECELEVARLICDLRQKWSSLLLRRLRNPSKPLQQQDEALLSTIVAVLTTEEQSLGLRQPSGVGARPRPMATELCNQNDPGTTDGTLPNTTIPLSLPSSNNMKPQPTPLLMNAIDSNFSCPFINECGDTTRLDTISGTLQPEVWSDHLTDSLSQLKLGDAFQKQEYQLSLNMSQMTNAIGEDAERLKFLTPKTDENKNNVHFTNSAFSFESL